MTPIRGGGNGTLTVTAIQNDSDARSTEIVISGGGVTRKIPVSQVRSYNHTNRLVIDMVTSQTPDGYTFEYDLESGLSINGNIWLTGSRNMPIEVIIRLSAEYELKTNQSGEFVSPTGDTFPWAANKTARVVRLMIVANTPDGVYVSREGGITFTTQGHDIEISFGIAVRINS